VAPTGLDGLPYTRRAIQGVLQLFWNFSQLARMRLLQIILAGPCCTPLRLVGVRMRYAR